MNDYAKSDERTKEAFSVRLKKLRTEAGLTQAQLADKLGVSVAALSYYEIQKRVPDIIFLSRVKDFFDVSTDYLLGITDIRKVEGDLKSACEYTGLSEQAILNLRATKHSELYNKSNLRLNITFLSMLNYFLTCETLSEDGLLYRLFLYIIYKSNGHIFNFQTVILSLNGTIRITEYHEPLKPTDLVKFCGFDISEQMLRESIIRKLTEITQIEYFIELPKKEDTDAKHTDPQE